MHKVIHFLHVIEIILREFANGVHLTMCIVTEQRVSQFYTSQLEGTAKKANNTLCLIITNKNIYFVSKESNLFSSFYAVPSSGA